MANATRVRVERRLNVWRSASEEDIRWAEQKAFEKMLREFKRQVGEEGILKEAKQREFFETKHDKDKRKRKESRDKQARDLRLGEQDLKPKYY